MSRAAQRHRESAPSSSRKAMARSRPSAAIRAKASMTPRRGRHSPQSRTTGAGPCRPDREAAAGLRGELRQPVVRGGQGVAEQGVDRALAAEREQQLPGEPVMRPALVRAALCPGRGQRDAGRGDGRGRAAGAGPSARRGGQGGGAALARDGRGRYEWGRGRRSPGRDRRTGAPAGRAGAAPGGAEGAAVGGGPAGPGDGGAGAAVPLPRWGAYADRQRSRCRRCRRVWCARWCRSCRSCCGSPPWCRARGLPGGSFWWGSSYGAPGAAARRGPAGTRAARSSPISVVASGSASGAGWGTGSGWAARGMRGRHEGGLPHVC